MLILLEVEKLLQAVKQNLADGSIPSLSQRFTAKTGLNPVTMLTPSEAGGAQEPA